MTTLSIALAPLAINWEALGVVAVVSIVSTLAFTALLAGGIRLVSQAGLVGADHGGRATVVRISGYALLGLAGLVVLYGIYLILPLGH